jgi:hypothetical protein
MSLPTCQNYGLLTRHLWSGWKMSFNDSNWSVCKLPTSTVYISIQCSCQAFSACDVHPSLVRVSLHQLRLRSHWASIHWYISCLSVSWGSPCYLATLERWPGHLNILYSLSSLDKNRQLPLHILSLVDYIYTSDPLPHRLKGSLRIKSNVICAEYKRCRRHSDMRIYKPLTNNAVLRKYS